MNGIGCRLLIIQSQEKGHSDGGRNGAERQASGIS